MTAPLSITPPLAVPLALSGTVVNKDRNQITPNQIISNKEAWLQMKRRAAGAARRRRGTSRAGNITGSIAVSRRCVGRCARVTLPGFCWDKTCAGADAVDRRRIFGGRADKSASPKTSSLLAAGMLPGHRDNFC